METLFLGLSKLTQAGIWLWVHITRVFNKNASWSNMHWGLQYFPAMVFYAGLAIKHRDTNIYGAANPKMDGLGGFIGVPKFQILQGKSAQKFLPTSLFLSAPHNAQKIIAQLAASTIQYPCIIKPNIGERGIGVKKIKSQAELLQYITAHPTQNLLVQTQITAMREWGVLLVRNPKTSVITVPDAAEKIFPTAIGNGHSTLSQLIDSTNLTKRQKQLIKQDHTQKDLAHVLPKGTRKALLSVASINLGAQVVSLSKADQKLLQPLCQQIMADQPHIHAGRLDLKADTFQDLIAGNCWVIELNGVGGMPTSVYSQAIPLFQKYTIMLAHFKRVSLIGLQNKQKYNIKSAGFWRSMRHIQKGLQARKKL
jgi:D-alanine-D-alanine ligase-like ATP-grasp enzyme